MTHHMEIFIRKIRLKLPNFEYEVIFSPLCSWKIILLSMHSRAYIYIYIIKDKKINKDTPL